MLATLSFVVNVHTFVNIVLMYNPHRLITTQRGESRTRAIYISITNHTLTTVTVIHTLVSELRAIAFCATRSLVITPSPTATVIIATTVLGYDQSGHIPNANENDSGAPEVILG